ncbi:MAG: glycosyltransferase [Novosphingobium sp.]|uniref:glycosyltransferase n=1 Tax=Novosphingobium sp. TaxID=1874826 RepID=UPI003C7E875D
MHLVDVCAFYTPHGGGVKTYVEQKLKWGPQLGARITVLAPGDDHSVTDYGHGAQLITIPSPRLVVDKNYWYFGDQAALHAALDRLAPDLAECSSPWRSPSWVANWRPDVPKALFMHADPMSAYAYRWFDPLLPRRATDRLFAPYWHHIRTLSARYDSVICASRDLHDRMSASGVPHCRLEPMGVDDGVFAPDNRDPALRASLLAELGLPESAGLLIGVGRLSAEKRWPLVIEGVRLAAKKRQLGLLLLGGGRQADKVRAAIGNDPHMRLLEPIRDRAQFAAILASGDALVHGCEAETFGLAAAEARASGVPVVVPDRGGAAEQADGGGGLTYRSADRGDLARAVLELGASGWPRSSGQAQTMRGHFERLFAHYRDLIAAH